MKIPLVFLGTGQAIPTISRNHSAIFLEYGKENILIDCGEGTQRQFRKAKINMGKVTRILITHWHGDHVLGLPGLFQTLALNNYQKTLYIYGPKGTKEHIKNIFKIFIPVKKINIKIEEVSGKFFENEDFILRALSLKHGVMTNGYVFQEKDKIRIDKNKISKLNLEKKDLIKLKDLTQGKDIEINGKKIKVKDYTYKQKGKKISFIFDSAVCPNVNKLAKDSDLAIMESTYFDEEDLAMKYNHMTLFQACEIAKKQNVKRLILTHLSQRFEFKENYLIKEAKKIFPNVEIAKDLMKVEI